MNLGKPFTITYKTFCFVDEIGNYFFSGSNYFKVTLQKIFLFSGLGQ